MYLSMKNLSMKKKEALLYYNFKNQYFNYLIFHLKKPYIELAKQEIIELIKPKKFFLIDDLFFLEKKYSKKLISFLSKRLGFSHSIYRLIFFSDKYSLIKKIEFFNWNKVYKKDFCVRYHGKSFNEREIANIIYKLLDNLRRNKKPKVNLKKPNTKIVFFEKSNKEIIGSLFLCDIDKSYNKRKAHLRPGFHPTSLSPDLAKACINLTGLKKGIIFDPFCGSGGILIEAALMGFYVIGNDIINKQLELAKKNFDYFNIKNYKLFNLDSLTLNKNLLKILLDKKINEFNFKNFSFVSDLPYGKGSYSSLSKNLFNLYYNFLLNLKKFNLKNKIVLIIPHFVDYKNIIKKSGWRIKFSFNYYVHKSLTRVILVLALD